MTAVAPWSVKGIDPKAREVAKDLARRSGMTLGEWLNRVILEDDIPEEVGSEAHFTPRPQGGAPPSHLTTSPADAAIESTISGDFGRIARALDRLTDRIEASETRTGLAISGVEHSVRQAVARIDVAERSQAAAISSQGRQSTVASVESPIGPRSPEAVRRLDARIRDMAAPRELPDLEAMGRRLAGAEARTAELLESLRSSLADLDRRISSVEGAPAELDRRLESMGEALADQVEAARQAFAERLSQVGGGATEARLAAMAQHVDSAERRSTRAIETMGREVVSLAQALTQRVQNSEQRSAEAIERVGGEVSHIAGMVESRLGHAEQAQADALEKLGAEMGRITERLTERLLNSERRAAQAIDDVGEQMSRVTDRFERRQERASADLAERIRKSEERTARLLEDGRRLIDERLLGRGAPQIAPATDMVEEPVETMLDIDAPGVTAAEASVAEALEAFGPRDFADVVPPTVELTPVSVAAEIPLTESVDGVIGLGEIDGFALAADAAVPARDVELHDEASVAADPLQHVPAGIDGAVEDFAPIIESVAEAPENAAVGLHAPVMDEERDVDRPLSTREVIEQARAAARAAQSPPIPDAEFDRMPKPRQRFFLRGLLRPRSRTNSTLQTAMMVAGGAAFLAVGAAGVVLLEGPTGEASSAGRSEPRAAVALAPQLSTLQAVAARDQTELSGRYADVLAGLQAGRAGALASLKALAEAEYAPAQLFLAKLYEKGEAGVTVNPAEARRWVTRAAEGGDPSAMHQLAVYDFRGEGAPANLPGAVDWFRKAAERGIVDSQYNLALLYRSGSGVERNLAEAYRWFSVAAANGDQPSRAAADELRAQLAPRERAGAEQAAAEVQPKAIPSETSFSVAAAQRSLIQQGYFKGAANGVSSPGFQVAVAGWQRDHGLAATGQLDPSTVTRLSVAPH